MLSHHNQNQIELARCSLSDVLPKDFRPSCALPSYCKLLPTIEEVEAENARLKKELSELKEEFLFV
jgi:hypothetical protein